MQTDTITISLGQFANENFTATQIAAQDTAGARRTIEAGISRFPADAKFRALAQELSRNSGPVATASASEMLR